LHTEGAAIHNGSDDNASGVSLVLALAKKLAKSEVNENILIATFSGEEKGLWGSNTFCDQPTIDLSKVKCMINFDMVGRMKEDSTLAVYGNGTSPQWNNAIAIANKDSLPLVLSESGVGPSDHTSFYLEDIPVLHLFTGQHEDYHKPSDDIDKINYDGIQLIYDFTLNLIHQVDALDSLQFTKTKDKSQDSASPFKVTLGVIPDYLFDGEGMRIDGTREDRPAENAGMIKGDVVLQMGDHKVTDMQTYMEGLSKFEEGDSTEVTFLRGEEEMKTMVTWD
ncbi:MAG: M28 family peptidase, partial [Bacteroidota bacterium]